MRRPAKYRRTDTPLPYAPRFRLYLGGEESQADVSARGDAQRIRTILIAAARAGRSVSYSELLGDLGFRFTRPKMRAVCKTLEEVDRLSAAGGEPDLAVLVVRESDRLPGQGWWGIGRASCRERGWQYVAIEVGAVQLKKKNELATNYHS